MAYKIVNQMNPSMYTYNAPYAMNPTHLVIHNTQNTATARNEVAYMNRTANYTSYHVAIDDKEAVQAIPFNRNAFHTGDGTGSRSGNRTAIGIEICYSLDGGNNGYASARYRQAEANAIVYAAHVLHQYGWGIDRLRTHQWYSGKFCPAVILHNGEWNQFKNRVNAELQKIKKGANTSTTVKAPAKKTTPKKTVAKVPSKKSVKNKSRETWGYHWSGTFTVTASAGLQVYRADQFMRTKYQVGKSSNLAKGDWVNFDHLFINNGYYQVRFKYAAKGSSTNYFFVPIGKRKTGQTFEQAIAAGDLWVKVENLNTNESKSGVTNWHKKGSVK